MMCMFCGNRVKCWDKTTDEELALEFVKCGYDDYVLDDDIELEDLLSESERRAQNRKKREMTFLHQLGAVFLPRYFLEFLHQSAAVLYYQVLIYHPLHELNHLEF